jgi:hypothetical protein
MKNVIPRIALTICATLFGASCADTLTPQTEESSTMEAETVPTPSAEGKIIITEYFENGVKVGSCVTQTCAPRGTHCTGRKTDQKEVTEDDCDATPPHPGPSPNPPNPTPGPPAPGPAIGQ